VAGVKVGAHGAIELVGLEDGIVRADLEHVLACLGGPAVDREGVRRRVDGAPVRQVRLVAGLDFPVLDEFLDQVGEAGRFVVGLLG
jgi:hypothetical protein